MKLLCPVREALECEIDLCQIELAAQNTELQLTNADLARAHLECVNLYENSPIALVILDADHNIYICSCNRHALNLVSGAAKITEIIHSNDQEIFNVFMQGSSQSCEFRTVDDTWLRCEGFYSSDKSKYYLALIDISEQKSTEDILKLGSLIFDESEEAIMIADYDQNILRVNQAFSTITGYGVDEVIGMKTSLLKSGIHDAQFYKDLWATLGECGRWQGEIWNKRKNGEIYPEWLIINSRKNGEVITHYIAIFSDITDRKNADSKIHYMAYYDPLTGLPNRAMLYDRIQQSVSKSKRSKNFNVLMLLDLDHFKVINDSLGHDIGDQLLIEVSKRLLSSVREEDTVSRLGGDEFVILLSELDVDFDITKRKAAVVAQKICRKLEEEIYIEGHNLHISVSIGVTLFSHDDTHGSDIIKNADVAMYRAKDGGRNKFLFFNAEMKLHADTRLVIENHLRHALQSNQFELYYQPQTCLPVPRICGAEALIRWNHPVNGLVMPDDFISIAEQTGLIIPIGTWVIREACNQIKKWSSLHGISYIAVNVSPNQFKQKNFVQTVIDCVKDSGIEPSQLELELTEGVLIQNIGDTLEKLKQLKTFGIQIAIDDFGTGYSSLNYLRQFPLDILKIDQSFIKDLHNPTTLAIVETIINLASSLGLRSMAEGVETEEQLNLLIQYKCAKYQGYLCSPPLSVSEFEEFIREEKV